MSQNYGQSSNKKEKTRLSQKGESLYKLLDIPKESSEQEIKKKYRRLALKYHLDKNPGNEEAEEMFKKINQAHGILTDPKKKSIYDKYGSFGLHLASQLGGEDNLDILDSLMMMKSTWFKIIAGFCFVLSGCCCCGCCFLCCCNCCCGLCKPKMYDEEISPDIGDLEEEDDVVTVEPTVTSAT